MAERPDPNDGRLFEVREVNDLIPSSEGSEGDVPLKPEDELRAEHPQYVVPAELAYKHKLARELGLPLDTSMAHLAAEKLRRDNEKQRSAKQPPSKSGKSFRQLKQEREQNDNSLNA